MILYIGAINLSPYIVEWDNYAIQLLCTPEHIIRSVEISLNTHGYLPKIYAQVGELRGYGNLIGRVPMLHDDMGYYCNISINTAKWLFHFRLRFFIARGLTQWNAYANSLVK